MCNRVSGVVVRRLLAYMACGAALAMASLTTTGEAHASPLSYLQNLNSRGVQAYDTQQLIYTGWAVCEALNTLNGAVVAENLYRNFSDVTSRAMANAIVIAAAEELCPWQIRGSQAT